MSLKGANGKCCLISEALCKMSIFSDFQLSQSSISLIFFEVFSHNADFFIHCAFVAGKMLKEKSI